MTRKGKRRKIDWYALALAALIVSLAGMGLLVREYAISGRVILKQYSGVLAVGVLGVVVLTCLYLALRTLFEFLDDCEERRDDRDVPDGCFRVSLRPCVRYALTLLICWLPYLIIRFPGSLDVADTVLQLMQTYGLKAPIDHHPWFDTLIFGAFWRLGDILGSNVWSLLIYAMVQSCITAASMSVALCWLDYVKVPKGLRCASLVFFALYPMVPVFAQTMAKDMLFAWPWLLFMVGYFEAVRTRGAFLRTKPAFFGMVIIALLVVMTKKTGIYLCLPSVVALALYCKKDWKRIVSLAAIPFATIVLWSSVLLPAWGVASGSQKEMLSIPSQQVAAIIKVHEGELSESDWTVLDAVYNNAHDMASEYVPTRADNTKYHWNDQASVEQKLRFASWLVEACFRFPDAFFGAIAANDYPLLTVDGESMGDESFIYYRDHIPARSSDTSSIEEWFASLSDGRADASQIHELYSDVYRDDTVSALSDAFTAGYLRLCSVMPVLFSKVLFATWIPLTVVVYSLRTKRYAALLCLIPVLLYSMSLAVGPVVLPRYLVPVVYATPLVLALLLTPRWLAKPTSSAT